MTGYAQTVNTGRTKTYKLGKDRPLNIINIYTDDEAYGELGTGTLRTTGVANLLASGTNFRNYRGVASLCEPSRMVEMTSQLQQNNGVASNNITLGGSARPGALGVADPALFDFSKMIYALLQGDPSDREYQTAHIGKWLGPGYEWAWNYAPSFPPFQATTGLDEVRIIGSCPPALYGNTGVASVPICTSKLQWQACERSYAADGSQIGADLLNPNMPVDSVSLAASPYPYSVDYIADQTLKIIDTFMTRPTGDQRKNLPFFLNVWPQAPHYPVNNPQNQLPLTSGAGAPPWAVNRTSRWNAYTSWVAPFWDYATYGNAADYYSPGLRGNITLPVPSGTMTDERCRMQSLIAVDDMIDAIIAKLTSYGILGNTVIIYASDNGYNRGEHGSWAGKDGFYESGLRVPLVMSGPDIPAGVNCDADAYNLDLALTMANIAGVTPTWTMDNAYDLRAQIDDPSIVSDRVVSLTVGRSVVTDGVLYGAMTPRYKVFYTQNQFFDLLNDPWENFNLYDHAAGSLKAGNAPWGTPCSWYAEAFSTMQAFRASQRVCVGATCFQTFDGVPHP